MTNGGQLSFELFTVESVGSTEGNSLLTKSAKFIPWVLWMMPLPAVMTLALAVLQAGEGGGRDV